jgi:hypothetical protein
LPVLLTLGCALGTGTMALRLRETGNFKAAQRFEKRPAV